MIKEKEYGICEFQQIIDIINFKEFAKILTDNIVSLYQISRKDGTDNKKENDEDDTKKLN